MKIEVWSDYVCPFCYIGKRHLEEALAQFPHKNQVEVEYKSFELDPTSPKDGSMSMYDTLAEKYGMSKQEAKKSCDGIAQQAATVGLTFRFDSMIRTNTFDAHRLAKFAKVKGKDAEMTETLLYAYFTESKHLGDRETLADLAVSVGLDRQEALMILNDDSSYRDEVRADQQRAKELDVRGVPFFVLNKKYAISGAQPVEQFLSALQQAWEEEQETPKLQDLSGKPDASCSDDGCAVPTENK